ncbi:MAG: type II toxin-antitoxin system PemK/MazF family toxin [Kouleothrix sp.]|nr:type II toxin-antitoxin system PemK/MazF family toxin [Kouleothrix sp.]
MNQGDVYWYTFKEPDKRRPVVILTRDSAIPYLTAVTIAPITSTIRAIPSEVVLSEADGLLTECAANCDNLQTIAKSKLGSYITHLAPERVRELREAIGFALGFDSFE